MFLKKKLIVITCLSAFVIIAVAAHKPYQPGDDFKNLKVLPKDISKDSLDAIMDGFKHALGVRCTFCHAANKDNPSGWPDFASDEKPEKDIARKMMLMTMDINKNYFNFNNSSSPDTISVVRCATCHRGSPHPEPNELMNDKNHHPSQSGNMQGNVPSSPDSNKPQ